MRDAINTKLSTFCTVTFSSSNFESKNYKSTCQEDFNSHIKSVVRLLCAAILSGVSFYFVLNWSCVYYAVMAINRSKCLSHTGLWFRGCWHVTKHAKLTAFSGFVTNLKQILWFVPWKIKYEERTNRLWWSVEDEHLQTAIQIEKDDKAETEMANPDNK